MRLLTPVQIPDIWLCGFTLAYMRRTRASYREAVREAVRHWQEQERFLSAYPPQNAPGNESEIGRSHSVKLTKLDGKTYLTINGDGPWPAILREDFSNLWEQIRQREFGPT